MEGFYIYIEDMKYFVKNNELFYRPPLFCSKIMISKSNQFDVDGIELSLQNQVYSFMNRAPNFSNGIFNDYPIIKNSGYRFIFCNGLSTQSNAFSVQWWKEGGGLGEFSDRANSRTVKEFTLAETDFYDFFRCQAYTTSGYSLFSIARDAYIDYTLPDYETGNGRYYLQVEYTFTNPNSGIEEKYYRTYEIQRTDNFEIMFYNNSSENIRVDKTEYLNEPYSISGVLRQASSLIAPIIQVEFSNVFNYNYCYIPKFGRYYYIDNIVSISNGLWEISMSVDVLMSYKEQIRNLDCFIDRQEFDNDVMLPDDMYPAKVEKEVEIITASFGTGSFPELTLSSNCYVVCMASASNGSTYKGVGERTYRLDTLRMPTGVMSSCFSNTPTICDIGSLTILIDYILFSDWSNNIVWLNANPNELITSVKLFPFDVYELSNIYGTNLSVISSIKQGGDEDTRIYGAWVGGAFMEGTALTRYYSYASRDGRNPDNFPNDKFISNAFKYRNTISFRVANFYITANDFTDLSPYSYCELYLPFYGYVELDINILTKYRNIDVYYIVDFITGDCNAVICSSNNLSNNGILYTYNFNISVDIPIVLTNSAEISRNVLMQSIRTVGEVASMVTSNYYSNKLSKMKMNNDLNMLNPEDKNFKKNAMDIYHNYDYSKVVNSKNNVANIINTASNASVGMLNAIQRKYSSGSVRNTLNGWCFSECFIKKVKPSLLFNRDSDEYRKYAHLLGVPCQLNKRLSELSGYTEVSGCHMEGFVNATPEEVSIIENTIKTGIIL